MTSREAVPSAGPASAASRAMAARIGRRIRTMRCHRGLTLPQLAEQASLSPSFLSLVETGKSDVSVGRLMRVADALQVTVLQLLAPSTSNPVSVVRASTPTRLTFIAERVSMVTLAPSHHGLNQFTLIEHEAGASVGVDDTLRRVPAAEVFFLLLAGRLAVELDGGETLRLNAGDSASFPLRRWQRSRSIGNACATVLACTSLPDGPIERLGV